MNSEMRLRDANSALVDLNKVRSSIGPVELAGYGREAVHKGYLTWLFDSRRWPCAREFLLNLARYAEWKDVERKKARKWFRDVGSNLRCKNEQVVGGRRVDLGVECTDDEKRSIVVPIELKVDSGIGEIQLTDMVPANG